MQSILIHLTALQREETVSPGLQPYGSAGLKIDRGVLLGKIELYAAEKWFDDNLVIKGIDLKIKDGEFIVFVGPSGCGKSTLLRMIG